MKGVRKAPRGICPECQRDLALAWCPGDPGDWAMRRHRGIASLVCEGTYCTPERMTREYGA